MTVDAFAHGINIHRNNTYASGGVVNNRTEWPVWFEREEGPELVYTTAYPNLWATTANPTRFTFEWPDTVTIPIDIPNITISGEMTVPVIKKELTDDFNPDDAAFDDFINGVCSEPPKRVPKKRKARVRKGGEK